jgi:23S rRNA pseudouridine2605 synthase
LQSIAHETAARESIADEPAAHACLQAVPSPQGAMRLAKYLAHAGVASRRAAEALVREGRVIVGAEVVTDPARDVDERSGVLVDGASVDGPEPRVVYAVHKPLGVLSTAHDPFDRPTVLALVPHEARRCYPVGRLDFDSTGLILLTNDGELAHRLTHPRFEVPKTYRVSVAGAPVEDHALRLLREGLVLEDGPTAPARVRRAPRRHGDADAAPGREALEITICEGRNRQVRRMCEAVGHPVQALARIAFGPLKLGDLPLGAHRRLSDVELGKLRAL